MPEMMFHAEDGKVAIWDGEGLVDRMGPFWHPEDHMGIVFFHSDLLYLASALVTNVTINHTALAGITGSGEVGIGMGGSSQPIGNGDTRGLSITMVNHGFGYPPPTFIMTAAGEILSGGSVLQKIGGMVRYGSSWADNGDAGMFETAISSHVDLPAISLDYTVFCFRNMLGDAGLPTVRISKPDEEIILGRKISHDARPLRVPALVGDAEFYLPLDPVVDARNGAVRTISPITGVTDIGTYTGSFFDLRSILLAYQ